MQKLKRVPHARVQKEIARRNEVFQAASPAEKRALIAKDVLVQIASGLFVAAPGVWAELPFNYKYTNLKASLQSELISGKVSNCNCCGIGALFLSCTLFNNQVTIADQTVYARDLGTEIRDQTPVKNQLNEFFTINQLLLIEIAFEGERSFLYRSINEGSLSVNTAEYQQEQAMQFHHRRVNEGWSREFSDRIRLEEIMENIIRNDGEFIP